jgi:hypothetical protein
MGAVAVFFFHVVRQMCAKYKKAKKRPAQKVIKKAGFTKKPAF